MALNFLRRLFKKRQTYEVTNDDDVYQPSADSLLFERESTSAPKLVKASPLSPLLWRFIFTASPAHPTDFDEEDTVVVSRQTHTRGSTTSSAGYGTGTSDDGGSCPGLGCNSSSGGFSSNESSPIGKVRQSGFIGEAEYTPSSLYPTLAELPSPKTLPPKTPHRLSRARLEYRLQKKASTEVENAPLPEESSAVTRITDCTPTALHDEIIPTTLPPVTPSFACHEVRMKKSRSSDMMEHDDKEEIADAPAKEPPIQENIWGTPNYSPASTENLDSPHSACTPHRTTFARHETRKISLRRQPSATVSGHVKQMVLFFENDSERVQMPRRLELVPAEFMRSCPQNYSTPSPSRTAEQHTTHSDLVRGVSTNSNHCTRCDSQYRTPNSRRASMA
ncbi:hypothetical protein PENTCL1PPCAC_3817 [Pristionchus entomophagus]|uniref:Uncharacterized protein n=1 Tax=Pristionchus entomophagus TaxID=358040 RepID=A0AAV5SE43_9BILA|nr:hypothetical protein PENTCL1PPCAC_3817 [Pristionchus entomophagus]